MIAMIAAVAKDNVIGQANRMPWRLPADLAYFKKLTMGHPVIMGRKTFESIGKPLPGRENVIITGDQDYRQNDCTVLHSIAEVLDYSAGKDVFIIGGAKIYEEFFPYVDQLYITKIEQDFKGDTFFPKINEQDWLLISKISGERNEKNPYEYYFEVYERKTPTHHP